MTHYKDDDDDDQDDDGLLALDDWLVTNDDGQPMMTGTHAKYLHDITMNVTAGYQGWGGGEMR